MEEQLNLFFGFLENDKKVSNNTLQSYERDLKQYEKYLNEQVDLYKAATAGKSQLHILSAFYECFPQKITPSIGISHGIAWDNPSNKNHDAISFWNSKRMFIESAMNCDKMISVDTNTANWFQTIDYELGNQKIKVIPNYVNTNEFKEDNSFKKEGKIIITYPRRLYEPRGMYLLLDIVDDLFKKYDNIIIGGRACVNYFLKWIYLYLLWLFYM